MAVALPTAVAEVRLGAMLQADLDPALTEDEVAALLVMARRPDALHRDPDDEEWTPTWHLAGAAAEGWRWKAAKAAHRVDAGADGGNVARSQLIEHCLLMARRYGAAGGIVSVPLAGRGPWDPHAGAVINLPEPLHLPASQNPGGATW